MMADNKLSTRDKLMEYIHPPLKTSEEEKAAVHTKLSPDMDEGNNDNTIDPMQRTYYKKVRSDMNEETQLIVQKSLKITERNVEKILELIDNCVKYLRWKSGSPYDSEERETFIEFIHAVVSQIRPEDCTTDEEKLSLWRKIINHILDGGFPTYMDEVWTALEALLAQHEPDSKDASIWDNLTKEELALVREFNHLMNFMLNATPEVEAPEVWDKMSTLLFPYVIKCMESILIQDLIDDPDHEQFKLTMDLFATTYNFLLIMQGRMDTSARQKISRIFKNFLGQTTRKNGWIHLEILKTLSACFTIQELKADASAGIVLTDVDVKTVMDGVAEAIGTGISTYKYTTSHAYDGMGMIRRLLLNKENKDKILQYGDNSECGIIGLALKGVESPDWRLQAPSLECLKIIAEDETLIERLRANENCTEVLKGARSSLKMGIRQMAVEVLLKILIKNTGEVKVTRNRLERTGCGSWTEYDVKRRIGESGFELNSDIDMTDCDGSWLIELLMMRRENSEGYYAAIKEQFGIEPRYSLPFNKCMSRLEKVILSGDCAREPPPFASLN